MSDDLQMVSVIETHANERDAVPRSLYAGTSSGVPAVGGQNGALEIFVRNPNGIIIDEVRLVQSSGTPIPIGVFVYVRNDRQPNFNVVVEKIIRLTSRDGVRTRAFTGTIPQADLFANTGLFTFNERQNGLGYFPLTVGRFLYISTNRSGLFVEPACLWHELPDDEPAT